VSALEPGLYRWSYGGKSYDGIIDSVGDFSYLSSDGDHCTRRAADITDARPLIVLDLGDRVRREYVVEILRENRHSWTHDVADQIEAQTKPARIPEPGWDGKVLAHTESNPVRREFIRYGVRPIPTHFNWNDSLGVAAQQWGDLLYPTLIREGVS
jgi:hypothetical protein